MRSHISGKPPNNIFPRGHNCQNFAPRFERLAGGWKFSSRGGFDADLAQSRRGNFPTSFWGILGGCFRVRIRCEQKTVFSEVNSLTVG